MVTDILDLIDGALDDCELSDDAMRWSPDVDREPALPHPPGRLGAVLPPALVADADGFIRVQLHTSPPWAGAYDPEIGDPRSAVRTQPASPYASGAWLGASPTHTWIDETHRWNVVPHRRTGDILAAAAIAWYGREALARHAARLEALAQGAEALRNQWGPAWEQALRLAFNLSDADFHAPRCPAHGDTGEPTDPMQRALWLRRNRNTGPKAKPRAPRRIDARGSR